MAMLAAPLPAVLGGEPFDASAETIDAYCRAALALLPPGPAWNRNVTGGYKRLLCGLAVEFARVHDRAQGLREEADPSTATELLADWERALGIVPPDLSDTAGRRAALVAKITRSLGHSAADYNTIAAQYGYTVEIRHADGLTCTQASLSLPVLAPQYGHAVTFVPSTLGGTLDQSGLEAAVLGHTQAHALVAFDYEAPRIINDLYAWYRSDDVVESGGLVSQWTDKSGNGRHVSQGTGSKQPTLVGSDAALGSMPSLQFDGVDDELLSAAGFVDDIGQDATLFWVGRSIGFAVTESPLSLGGVICGHYGTTQVVARAHTTSPAGSLLHLPDSGSILAGHAYGTRTSTSGLTYAQWVDGDVLQSHAITSANALVAGRQLAIANNPYDGVWTYSNCALAEVLVFARALTDAEVAQVFAYLQDRYGI